MFADDLVIIATSMDKLQTLFTYVSDFCTQQELAINATKTELMVCGAASTLYSPADVVQFGSYHFKVVRSFKYLGLHFDHRASTKHMVTQVLVKAN